MIAQLSGRLVVCDLNHLVLDVQGVGYLVHATGRTLGQVGQPGDAVTLLTELLVREDALTLYGFSEERERAAFKMLQTVQGVGAKAALSILTTLTADDLSTAIMVGDKAMVSRADGIGPKLAQRIVNELAQKLPSLMASGVMPAAQTAQAAGKNEAADGLISSSDGDQNLAQDALSALVNLGYSRTEAFAAIGRSLQEGTPQEVSGLIASALKQLGQGR